jgi:diadenosine tetraphosphate (Ap4A) HIT family hydrolase
MTCTFCNKFSKRSHVPREWFDEILLETPHFFVVPGLGALADGYSLVVSRTHEVSMAALPESQLSELRDIVSELRSNLSTAFEPLVLFEHGPACEKGGGGACIVHAHMHILPTRLNLADIPVDDNSFAPIPDLTHLRRFANLDYVFLELQDGSAFVGQGKTRSSQWFRRIVAERIGVPDEWDYAVFQHPARIKCTIAGYKTCVCKAK